MWIPLFIIALPLSFFVLILPFMVGVMWYGFVIWANGVTMGIASVLVLVIYLVIFALPQMMWPGSWLAEKCFNGAEHFSNFLKFMFLLPFHAFTWAGEAFVWVMN